MPALGASIFIAWAVTLALGAIGPVFAQNGAPVIPAAATGVIGAAPSAPIAESVTETAPAASAGADLATGAANDALSLGGTVIPSARQQATTPGIGIAPEDSQALKYEANQQMPLNEPRLHSLQEFVNEGVNTSPLGLELQEGERRAKDGREVNGLLVVALQPDGPAERAGVRAGHRAAHDMLEGVAVVASLFFPPAMLAIPVIETAQIGENYDLIIGIDGNRVTNFIDFQDQMREAQPGETVYLNVLRGDKRLQLPAQMP